MARRLKIASDTPYSDSLTVRSNSTWPATIGRLPKPANCRLGRRGKSSVCDYEYEKNDDAMKRHPRLIGGSQFLMPGTNSNGLLQLSNLTGYYGQAAPGLW